MSDRDDRRATDIRVPDPVPVVPLPDGNDLAVVRKWALSVMRSFGLDGWTFDFDHARRRMGAAHYQTKRITLSRHFVARNGPAEIKETMLHEVSHALVGPGHGHGPVWKAMAHRVGCKPVRCGNADMPDGRWQAVCGGCGRRFHRHRRVRVGRRMWCRRCGPDRGLLSFGLVREEA